MADKKPLRAALEQYFSNGGPDTPIRTKWYDGVPYWEAPAADIRELIENGDEESPEQVLTREQRARIECLQAARNVLVARGIATSGKADPIDLVNIAQYIETGEDPWPVMTPGTDGPDV